MLGPKHARILLIAVALSWALFWVSGAFVDGLDEILIAMGIGIGIVLASLFVLVDSVVAGVRGRGWRRLGACAAMIVLLVWPGWPIPGGLVWLGAAARLRPHQQEYEQQALAVLALPEDQLPPKSWYRDPGPPRRVALCLGGITDNWSGFVYDPSQSFDGASEEVFGGDLVSSRHLWGPWYYVVFT